MILLAVSKINPKPEAQNQKQIPSAKFQTNPKSQIPNYYPGSQ